MASDGEPDERAEWLETGTRTFGSRDLRWLSLIVALVVVAAGFAVVTYRRSTASLPVPAASSSAPAARLPRSDPTTEPPVPQPTLPISRIERIDLGGPLLGIRAGYQLVGYGSEGLVRILPATGTITRTSTPPVQSSGRLSVVAGDTFVVIRPADGVTGYVIPDGRSAGRLSGALSRASLVFPGPSRDRLWAVVSDEDPSGTPATRIFLVDRNGRRTGETLPAPYNASPYQADSDEAGHLMIGGMGGTYASGPDGLRRVTTGAVLAVGPTRWLTTDCDDRGRCRTSVVDRATGHRRAIPSIELGVGSYIGPGLISPDGRYASIATSASTGRVRLLVVELATGRQWPLNVRLAMAQPQVQVWAPDSRWLFLLGDDRRLRAVDPTNGSYQLVSASIPRLDILTLRPAR